MGEPREPRDPRVQVATIPLVYLELMEQILARRVPLFTAHDRVGLRVRKPAIRLVFVVNKITLAFMIDCERIRPSQPPPR